LLTGEYLVTISLSKTFRNLLLLLLLLLFLVGIGVGKAEDETPAMFT